LCGGTRPRPQLRPAASTDMPGNTATLQAALVGYSNVLQLATPFESEANIADAQWQRRCRYTKC
jgi:hypothetical protein